MAVSIAFSAQPTKVFVGSLPPGTKPEELRHLFENYGVVVECDVMNRCGFVHMKNPAMAEKAIQALNASEFKGQSIVVEHGRPKERGGGPQGGGPNQVGRGGGPQRGGGRGGVGFPGNIQHSNKAKQVATLQLASVILDLLNDQNQTENIAGGGGGGGGFLIGTGSGSGGGPMGGGGPRGGRSGGGNFQGGRGGGPQNMSGPGPMRNQGFKNERSAPYPSQNMNAGGPQGGGKFNQNRSGGMGGGGPGGNFGQNRGGNFNNSGDNGNWNNVSGGLGPRGGPNRSGGAGSGNFQNQARVGGGGGFNDNFSSGFSGNMNNVPAGNFGGQQDRRGFTLPTNQPPKYGVAGNQQGSGFGGDLGFGNDDGLFQRRNHNGPNMGGGPVGGNNMGGGNFNRGGNRGGGFNNRGGPNGGPVGSPQQQGGFKKNFASNNMNVSDDYQQQFPPLSSGNDFPQQGNFGNNRGANVGHRSGNFGGGFNRGGNTQGNMPRNGGPLGRGSFGGVSGGGSGGNMNRNAPRQNMPNRRY
ncbi:uncharacterized protein LOC101889452 isoform X1 [Musca domestica]|uniref:Uncharacterized protein LOC101889452 isoform X1 n=1 Tax=Musca domestica TaxID=7370 RepID=A0A9J7D3B2_MUSDO|nr:uncharacterized protein LOC101889452 isoform X1 [Musca domestica]